MYSFVILGEAEPYPIKSNREAIHNPRIQNKIRKKASWIPDRVGNDIKDNQVAVIASELAKQSIILKIAAPFALLNGSQ
jgi:hypothetical protein